MQYSCICNYRRDCYMSNPKKKRVEGPDFIAKLDDETEVHIEVKRPIEDEIAARLKAYMLKVYEQRMEKAGDEGEKEDGTISDV